MQNARQRTKCTAKRWSTRMGKREEKRETMGKAHGKTLIGDGWQIWPHRNVLCYGRQTPCQAHQLNYLHICISLLSLSSGVLLLCKHDVMVLVWCRRQFLFCRMLCYCILWVILLAQSHKCFRVVAMLLVVFSCRSQSKVDCCIFLWYFILQFRLVSLALVEE